MNWFYILIWRVSITSVYYISFDSMGECPTLSKYAVSFRRQIQKSNF